MQIPLQIKDLYKVYGGIGKKVVALNGIGLEVLAGEIFGIIGPNGAGKTTALKIVADLIYPTKGTVLVFGKPPSSTSAKKLIGFLPENPYFYEYLTAYEFLTFAGRVAGLTGGFLNQKVDELLKLVRLEDSKNFFLKKFSKGMLQRIGIAQALIHDPQFIILDEPASGLDPMGRSELFELFWQLKEAGKTILLSSHILEDVEQLVDRVALLVKGKVKFLGAISDIATHFCGWQIVVKQHPKLAEINVSPWHKKGNLVYFQIKNDVWSMLDILKEKGVELMAVEPIRGRLGEFFIKEVPDEG